MTTKTEVYALLLTLEEAEKQLGGVEQELEADLHELEERWAAALEAYARAQERIRARYAEDLAELNEMVDGLTEDVKAACIDTQETVQGRFRQVVYYQPRVTWNGDGLHRLMAGDEAMRATLAPFRKVGNPSARVINMKNPVEA